MKKFFFLTIVLFAFFSFTGVTKLQAQATWNYVVTGSAALPLDTIGSTRIFNNSGAGDGDDDAYALTFPFAFEVYDATFANGTGFSMNSNGYLRFDGLISGGSSASNATIPTNNATFGMFLSYGGNTDGMIQNSLVRQKIHGTSPNRVMSLTFTYYTYYSGGTAYHADVQVNLYETTNVIKVHYSNHGGSTTPANYIGINAGDNSYGTNLGFFPSVDTSFTFSPGAAIAPPTTFFATANGSSTINLTWAKNATNDDVVIARNTTNTFGNLVNNSVYSVGNALAGGGTIIYTGSLLAFSNTGLQSNTTYYYKIWSKGATNKYSITGLTANATTSAVAPPTGFSATPASTSKIDLAWTKNAANDSVVIVMNTVNTFTNLTNNVNYAVGYNFGLNQAVVYRGPLSAFTKTALNVNTTYYFKVYSVNGYLNYSTGVVKSATTMTVADPSNFTCSSPNSSSINLNWNLNPNSDFVMIAYNTTNTFAVPVTGTTYAVGNQILAGQGTVCYAGSLTTFLHSGLLSNTTYYYKIWSYDLSHNYSAGLICNSTTSTINNPQSFAATAASTTSINLTWTLNASNDNVMVVFNTTNTFATPANGTSYTVGNQIAAGQGTVLYKGSLLAFTHSSLAVNTTYYYKIYSYNASNQYSSGGLSTNATTLSIPNPQSFTATGAGSSQINLSWVLNTYGNNIMIAYNTTNTFATPQTAVSYVAGNQIAAGQGTVLYVGSALSFNHTGLSINTTYYYKIWSLDATPNYSNGLTANATTVGVADPIAFDATANGASQIDLTWTKNASNQSVMIAFNTIDNFTTPFNGFPYIVGNQMGVNAGTVLYIGTGTSFSHTGLLPNTKYYYKIWSIDASNYYSTGLLKDSATTYAPGISTYPYLETFELQTPVTGTPACNGTYNLTTGWQNVTGDNIDWIPFKGQASPYNTGPDHDNTLGNASGIYMMVAGYSATNCYNMTGYLVSPLLNFQNLTNPMLDFYYHMYGNNMGSISVQISTDGGGTWSSNLFIKNGQQHASRGAAYTLASMSLSAYAGMTNIKIRIKGLTGPNYLSTMAIDDIKIYQPQNMVYVSSTTSQDTVNVVLGQTSQQVMRIKISTVGNYSALTLGQLTLNTNGSTAITSDVSAARLYYTGTNPTFSTIQQVGSAWTNPSGTFPLIANQVLIEGDNYFWVAYDIKSTATIGNSVDCELTSFILSSVSKVPTVTAPAGNKKIVGQVTVGTGTIDNSYGPLYPSYANGAAEMIYLASELGTGAKEINKIAFYKGSGTNVTNNYADVKIYMANSTDATFSNGYPTLSDYTQVYQGSFPNNIQTGWLEVAINTFLWDGTSNLKVFVVQASGTNWNPYPMWRNTATSPIKARGAYGTAVPTNLTTYNNRPNVRFEYALPASMIYSTSTATQNNTTNAQLGGTKQEVIGITINTSNTANPLAVTSFTCNTAGTTNVADISNARIFYTNTTNKFDTLVQFGSVVAAPNGTFNIVGSQLLNSGVNYFWLTYDVLPTATVNNFIDATCTSVYVGGNPYTPSVTNPTGNRKIRPYLIIGSNVANSPTDPIHYYSYYNVWEGIYTKAELGGAKDITKLAFYKALGNNITNNHTGISIYIKNTADSVLNSGAWSYTGYTQVYGLNDNTFPNNAPTGWMEVTLDNAFSYDGTGSIQVLVTQNYGTYYQYMPQWGNYNVNPGRARTANSFSALPTSLTAVTRMPYIRFEYNQPAAMTYTSATTTQFNTTSAYAGLTNQEIIGVQVVTANSGNPLSATSFTFNTNGTTNVTDILNAKVFYTGNSNVYAAVNQFGTIVANPNGSFTITGTQALASGTNYFWLAYDVNAAAVPGSYLDAQCTGVKVGGIDRTLTVTNPGGNRVIIGAMHGIYTIGVGGDYSTFTAAVNALTVYGVSAPVTFQVFDGTYNEQISLSAITNVSATAPVVFESQNGDSTAVVLTFASSSTANNYTVQFSNAKYISFKNMTVKNTGTQYSTVFNFTAGADYNEIRNCVISGTGTITNNAGINIASVLAHYNKIKCNSITQTAGYAINLRGTGVGANLLGMEVDSNTLNTNGNYTTYIYYVSGFKFRGNVVTKTNNGNFHYGLYAYYAMNGSQFIGNRLTSNANNQAYSFYLRMSDGTPSEHNIVANNFVFQNGTATNQAYGIYANDNDYTDIVYNNVRMTSAGTQNAGIYVFSNVANVVKNNIVSATGYGLQYASIIGLTSNYNNIFTTGSFGIWQTAQIATLAAWKTTSGQDNNSNILNPNYISATDLHCNNFNLKGKGTPISGVTTDIDGESRDLTMPDFGADEIAVSYDAQITNVVAPISPVCQGNLPVIVTIKNKGNVTLTSASIRWSVNGIAQTNYAWSGLLVKNDSIQVNLPNYNFSTVGNVTIKSWTALPNGQADQVPYNDSTTKLIVVNGLASVDAGVNASICAGKTHTTAATGTGYSSLVWSTSGTGTFVAGTTLTAVYTPSASDVTAGSVYLKISAVSTSGCGTVKDSLLLTITTLPTINFSGLPTTICPNVSPVTLVGSPTGGVFSGPGISGTTFNPKTAGNGTHVIKYVYTSTGGCKDSITKSVTVHPSVLPTISGLQTTYCISESADILTGTPSGGTWSGSITSNTFDPAIVGLGNKTVKYTYFASTTGCTFDTTYYTTVQSSPTINISGLNPTYCTNGTPSTLSATPTGGTFSGPGISGNVFNPATAGAGTHVINYAVSASGCSGSQNQSVIVYAAPSVSFTGLSTQTCSNGNNDTLYGTPTGGSFSGPGLVGNIFKPAVAGVGTHSIVYSYTNTNSCTSTQTKNITVNSAPIANAGTDINLSVPGSTTLNGSYTGGSGTMSYSWSPIAKINGSATIANPTTTALTTSTVYTLVVTASPSGCNSSDQVVVNVGGTALSASASAGPSGICLGDSSTLSVLASGGTGTYSYMWASNPAGFTSSLQTVKVAPTVTTTYTVVATDGISFVPTSTTITVYPRPTVNFSGLGTAYCSNASVVTLTGTPSGGTFSGDGIVGNVFNPGATGSGVQQITYTYNNGTCSNAITKSTTVNSAPIANAGSGATIPYNTSTTLSGSFTGGSGTTSYSWTPASKLVNATIQNPTTTLLTALTTFTLTTTSSPSGCSSSAQVTINVQSPTLTANISATPTSICEGDSSMLTIQGVGGLGSYTYTWSSTPAGLSSTAATVKVFPTVTTTYSCIVNDGYNAPITKTVIVNVNAKPVVSFSGLAATYCSNASVVSLSGLPNGGTFSGAGIVGNTFNPGLAGVGTHAIKYTYSNGTCSNSQSQNTTVNSTPIANAGVDPTIEINNDTILYGSYTGGSGTVSYSWTPASLLVNANIQNPSTVILTTSQVFTLTTTASPSGCFSTDQVTVLVTSPTLSLTTSATPGTICQGDSSTIAAVPSGGNGIYTYAWSSSPVGFTSSVASIKVAPTVTTTYTCYVTSNSGTKNATSSSIVIVNPKTIPSFSGLAASYCSNEPTALLNPTPPGGSFSGNGISGNSFTPATAGVGTHAILYTYTNTFGCTGTATQNVTVKATPIANAGPDPATINSGTSTSLSGSATGAGNYKFSWTPTSLLVNPNIANPTTVNLFSSQNFTLTVRDSISNCYSTDDVYVTVNTVGPLAASASATPAAICLGASSQLNVNATGGTGTYTYQWTSNPVGFTANVKSPVVTPTSTTVYTVIVYDGSSTVSSSATVTVNPIPVVGLGGLDTSYCKNGIPAVLVGVPTGGVYAGNGVVANIFTPVMAGVGSHTISYSYTDGNGCSNSISKTTKVFDNPVSNAGSDLTIYLYPPSITSEDTILYGSASGGSGFYKYAWTPTNKLVVSNIANAITTLLTSTTQYTLTVTDSISTCTATDDMTVKVIGGALSVSPITNQNVICNGQTAQLQALPSGGSGNYTYYWSSNPAGFNSTVANPVVKPSVTTTYTVIINDGANNAYGSVLVAVNPTPNVVVSGFNASYCLNNQVDTLIGSPSGGLFIGTGMNGDIFNPSIAGVGTHEIIYAYANSFNCVGMDTINIQVKSLPTVNAGNDINIVCGGSGGLIGTTPVGGMTYSWTPVFGLSNATLANPIANPNMSVNYTLTGTNTTTGCSNSDQVFVNLTNGPTAVVSNDTIVCLGSPVNLWATGGTNYLWSNGVTTNAFSVTPLFSTVYKVTVTDGSCSDVDSIMITVNDPTVYLGPDFTVLDTQSVFLDAGFGYAQYLWSTGATTQSIEVKLGVNAIIGWNKYKVFVKDAYGCSSEDSVYINIILSGIDNIKKDIDFEVYPNPTKGIFTLDLRGVQNKNYTMEILNLQGQLILSEEIFTNNNSITKQFDVNKLAKGVYIIRILSDGAVKTKKLIIN